MFRRCFSNSIISIRGGIWVTWRIILFIACATFTRCLHCYCFLFPTKRRVPFFLYPSPWSLREEPPLLLLLSGRLLIHDDATQTLIDKGMERERTRRERTAGATYGALHIHHFSTCPYQEQLLMHIIKNIPISWQFSSLCVSREQQQRFPA